MKRFMLIFCSLLITLGATAQSKLGSQTTKIAKDSTLIKIHDLLEDVDFRIHGLDRYKLYPTENIYNFLQLDTSTGKIDVVQWSLDDGKEGSVTLNDEDLSLDTGCGTFELYPTKNMYQFILLDKVTGRKWHVQWGFEEFMTGREVSVLSFVDGNTIKTMTSAQDHKRAGDGDTGLNTGGMGTFSPSPFYTEEVDEFCKKYVYQPTVDAMKAEGRDFVGILFVGLMMTQDGPKVLEYNARFGDPEAQVVLPRMKNDIIDVMEACIDGKLDQVDLQFEDNAAVCVVLASDGYPEHYEKGKKITFLKNFASEDGYYAFHAGTKLTEDGLVTNGGRVLGITAKGATLKEARKNAYKATEWVTFDNKYMRNDIGKAIDEI